MYKVAKSDKMALSGSKLGFVSDLELIPLGQFSQYFVPPVGYQVHKINPPLVLRGTAVLFTIP